MVDETVPIPVMDDAAIVVAYLAERDAACPMCGYNLRGQKERCCPECGEKIELHLGVGLKRDRSTIRLARALALVFIGMHLWAFAPMVWVWVMNPSSGGLLGFPLWSVYGALEFGIPVFMIVVWSVMLFESRRGPRIGYLAATRWLVYSELIVTLLPLLWWLVWM